MIQHIMTYLLGLRRKFNIYRIYTRYTISKIVFLICGKITLFINMQSS